MNKIMLIGNLTKDPDMSSTQGGVSFTRFTIAVNRLYTNAAGERVADYFNIICWRQLAERCHKYLCKGNKVGIVGSVQCGVYEDRDGIKRKTFDVVADEVQFLTPKTANSQYNAPEPPRDGMNDMQPVDPEDLPF